MTPNRNQLNLPEQARASTVTGVASYKGAHALLGEGDVVAAD